jgi:hypothetical protein
MLDFLGFIVTLALMVLAVNALITFMDVSQSAKLTLAALAGLWIGLDRSRGIRRDDRDLKTLPGHRIICGSTTYCGSNRGGMASRARSHVEHTDATNDRPECGSRLRSLVSIAGGRRTACRSVPALRRLGRYHHRRLRLARGMARQRCGNETSQHDRCMGPVRRGRSHTCHYSRRDVGRRFALADLHGCSRVGSDAAAAMVVCSDSAGSILADPARDHLGPASSLANQGYPVSIAEHDLIFVVVA